MKNIKAFLNFMVNTRMFRLKYHYLIALFVFSVMPLSIGSAYAQDTVIEVPEDYAFRMIRKGKTIGTHSIKFSQIDDALQVDIVIDIKVKFGPLTVFKYGHTNREIWRDDRLASIETITNDNGKHFKVSGVATENGFRVKASKGEILLPAEILPTTYWRQETIHQKQLLNTQEGGVLSVQIASDDEEEEGVQGYLMSGGLELEFGYKDGRLCKLAFEGQGAMIRYRAEKFDQQFLKLQERIQS